jgi:hypothetical protein
MTVDVLETPALALLCQLEAAGFEFRVTEPDILRVRPQSRVTPELRAKLRRHKSEILVLIRICDAGVLARRQAFARQLETAPDGVIVPRLVFRETPYVSGRCHACGNVLESARWGSCWRCSFARRLACHAPIPVDLFATYDEARICA